MGRRVLVAEHRAGRPNNFVQEGAAHGAPGSDVDCPFCIGHESLTPAALFESRGENGQWQVRVIPNKYPAVSLDQKSISFSGFPVLCAAPLEPHGAHEVIVESPTHVYDVSELSPDDLATVLRVYRDRVRFWAGQDGIQHVTVFKNVGTAAGASLEHTHSQLVALPITPPAVAAELQACEQYYNANQACVFCCLLDEELSHNQRLVSSTDQFAAFCASAGRQPYETWILPRNHSASFEELSDTDTESLADLLHQVIKRLQTVLQPLSYNLILHSAPFSQAHADQYHWHFELVPRSTQLAGFEWGTGMHINPLAPERAAARLRNASV